MGQRNKQSKNKNKLRALGDKLLKERKAATEASNAIAAPSLTSPVQEVPTLPASNAGILFGDSSNNVRRSMPHQQQQVVGPAVVKASAAREPKPAVTLVAAPAAPVVAAAQLKEPITDALVSGVEAELAEEAILEAAPQPGEAADVAACPRPLAVATLAPAALVEAAEPQAPLADALVASDADSVLVDEFGIEGEPAPANEPVAANSLERLAVELQRESLQLRIDFMEESIVEQAELNAMVEEELAAAVEAVFAAPVRVEKPPCSKASHRLINFVGAAARWVAPVVAVGIVVVIKLRR